MSASIPGRNRAVFLLTYEELLQRRLGRYEHVTSLRPLQLVSRLRLDVTIVDHSPIRDLEVLPLRNGRSSGAANAGPNTPGGRMSYCLTVSPIVVSLFSNTLPVFAHQPSSTCPSAPRSQPKRTCAGSPSARTSSSRPRSPPTATWETL